MGTGVTPRAGRGVERALLGVAAFLLAVVWMGVWWGIQNSMLHDLFHGPVLSRRLNVRYSIDPVIDLAVYQALADSGAILLPFVFALNVAARGRGSRWVWLGCAIVLGGVFGGAVFALNPNWYGVELAAGTQGAWVWACAYGLICRWVARLGRRPG